MKRIGLFGGTFDPIHNGHIHIAKSFADELNLETVIFLPAGTPYHKVNEMQASAHHRLAMIELIMDVDERFAVSDCDVVRKGATYTFDTVQIFRQQIPSTEFWWLLGMDSLLQLHTWKKWQTLVQQINIAVAMRQGDSIQKAPRELHSWIGEALQNGHLQLLNAPVCNVSSTQIRQRLMQGQSVDEWLDKRVIRYIRHHHLYQK